MILKRFALGVLLAIASAGYANAQSIECDSQYTTRSGDSLSKIAGQAYGRTTAYQPIFDYNPGALGTPSDVPVGVKLYIPCLEGSQPSTKLDAFEPGTSSQIKILTGAEYPPYVDNGLPEGGFSNEVVQRALLANGGDNNFRVDVINDWGSHLQPLLAEGAYQLGFPWFKPDCSQYERLGEASQWRCDNLRFSESLHEVVITFFARNDRAGDIRQPSDANGLKICRPRGYFTHDLEVMELTPPRIIRVAGSSPTDCFERLRDGEVDLVSVNADTSDTVINELGIRNDVSEVINLATVQTLHVVGMRSDPQTRPTLLRFNQGLLGLRDDGVFRQLASKHLGNN